MEANILNNKIDDIFNVEIPTYTKINLNDTLDFISPNDTLQSLTEIKSKLLPRGILTFQSFDLYELCYGIVNDYFSSFDFNLLIKDRKQLLSVSDLVSILQKLKLKIISKDIDAFKYYVEAQIV